MTGHPAAALRLAREHAIHSIAFPALSTGIYGFPVELATPIAVSTVRAVTEELGGIERVIFACFSPEVERAYRAAGAED